MGWHLYFAGRYDEAVAQLHRTLELDQDFPLAHFELGMVFLQQGRVSAAVEELELATELGNDSPIHIAALGGTYARAGRLDDARDMLLVLEQLDTSRFVPALYFAGLHISLGDRERALESLDTAYQERAGYLLYLSLDPTFSELKDEPRFESLLNRLGMPRPTG